MKRNVKKIIVSVYVAILMVISTVPVFATTGEGTNTGEIGGDDLVMHLELPADGVLDIAPISSSQISTEPLYIVNNEAVPVNSGDDIINYNVGIAGYTCVAVSADSENPIRIVTEIPDNNKKTFTANIELGTVIDKKDMVTGTSESDKKNFNNKFGAITSSLPITRLSEISYDGTIETSYIKATEVTKVKLEPQQAAPFRITGTMNLNAEWTAGDSFTIVTVYAVDIEVSEKK